MRASQARTDSGLSKCPLTSATMRPTEKPKPPNCEMTPNTGSSVVSSPMKIGLRSGERRAFHQFAHRVGLVDAGRLDLDDQLAGQDLDRARRHARRKSCRPQRAPRRPSRAPADNARRANSPCPRRGCRARARRCSASLRLSAALSGWRAQSAARRRQRRAAPRHGRRSRRAPAAKKSDRCRAASGR